MKFSCLLFLTALLSCHDQNNIKLTFVNRSSTIIDSIVVSGTTYTNLGKLGIGQQYSKDYTDINIGYSEGMFGFIAYRAGKKYPGQWGFHDMGHISKEEKFFILDNGVNWKDTLKKPAEFKLYFTNTSSDKIDTIISKNASITRINERTPRNFEITYDYNKIESTPEFIASISGRNLTHKIEHDFSNWNDTQAFLFYERGQIKKDNRPWQEPQEFLADLLIKINYPVDSIKIISDAVVKEYSFNQPTYKRIVFDFKKLRQNPHFDVIVGDKKHRIDLSSHNFSNIYDNQKIFYLEEHGIRSLRD